MRAGMVNDVPCLPGTFSANFGSVNCLECPAGFSCETDGVELPAPCPSGLYRASNSQIACMSCSQGKWSRKTTVSSGDLCEPCPAGVVCPVEGMSSLRLSSPCPEGYVCGAGTNSSNQFEQLCPAGYYCDFGTTPSTQFDLLCEEGFGCPAGTGYTQRKRYRCDVGYYCPKGSISSQPQSTQCPVGTTSAPLATNVYDCFKDPNGVSRLCYVSPYYDDLFDECLLSYKCSKTVKGMADYLICVQQGLQDANYVFADLLQNEYAVNTNFYKGQAMTVVKVSFDWRYLPIDMIYGEHYQLVMHIFNQTTGMNLQDVRPGYTGTWFGNAAVDKHGIMSFNVLCLRDTYIRFDVEILHGLYIENKNYTSFRDTAKFETLVPSRASTNADVPEQFYILLPRSNTIAPPLNVVPTTVQVTTSKDSRGNEVSTVQFVNELQPLVDFAGDNSSIPLIPQQFSDQGTVAGVYLGANVIWPTTNNVDLTDYVLPYLPFFSSCRGFDSHIPLFLLLESYDHCNLVPYNQTKWVNQWDPFGAPSPIDLESSMDSCQWSIQCAYEEEIDKVSTVERWFEQKIGEQLFFISRDPYPYSRYSAAYAGDKVQEGMNFFINMESTSRMVPVTVEPGSFAVSDTEKLSGVPRSVNLQINYYQRSKGDKRIISATISFDDYTAKIQNNTVVRDYSLNVDYRGLDYLSLLNGFSFDPEVYIILFLFVGIGCLIFFMVFWAFQRIFTRLSNPPRLHLTQYLSNILLPIWGLFAGLFPVLLVFGLIHGLFRSLAYPVFGNLNELYTNFGSGSKWSASSRTSVASLLGITASQQVEQGRLGVALMTLGVYLSVVTAFAFVPGKEDAKSMFLYDPKSLDEKSSDGQWKRKVNRWYRTQFIFSVIMSVLVNTVVLEYSFSDFFKAHIYESLIAMPIFFIFFQNFLNNVLGDLLLVQPMAVSYHLIEIISTLGAATFLDFMQVFVFQLLYKVCMRIYIYPGIQNAKELINYLISVMKRYQEKRDREDDLEEGDEDFEDELFNEVEFETFSPAENIIMMLSNYSAELIVLLYYPFIILFLWWADGIGLQAGSHYGLRTTDFVFYVLFSLFVIPFRIFIDTLVLSSNELFHGWKILDYMKYCRHRFLRRSQRWRSYERSEDASIHESLQNLDLNCFSSQYYFTIGMGAIGSLLIMFSLEIISRNYHNPFGDKMTTFVILVVLCLIWIVQYLCRKFGLRFLWKIKPPVDEYPIKEMPPKELTLPDLSKPATKDADVTSESFKHKFLNANRSWLIEQLRGSLPEGGGYGDAQSDASGGGGGRQDQQQDRDYDISSDEGSSESDGGPPATLDDAAKAVVRAWIARTRSQLGLPEKGISRPDISSDSDRSSTDDDEGQQKQVSNATRNIARRWLAQIRAEQAARGEQQQGEGRLDISSDDSSSEDDNDRPRAAPSTQTQAIAMRWLSQLRGRRSGQPQRAPAEDISSEDSSSEDDRRDNMFQVNAVTARIARIWLNSLPRNLRARPGASFAVSDDDSSSSDGEPARAQGASIPQNLPQASRRILRMWLEQIR